MGKREIREEVWARPAGISWELLPREKIEAIPVLRAPRGARPMGRR